MLVLSRKSKESVVVGGSVSFARLFKVKVLQIRAGRVRLGFEVDADIPVNRLEVWERSHSDLANQPRRNPQAVISELGRWMDDGGTEGWRLAEAEECQFA